MIWTGGWLESDSELDNIKQQNKDFMRNITGTEAQFNSSRITNLQDKSNKIILSGGWEENFIDYRFVIEIRNKSGELNLLKQRVRATSTNSSPINKYSLSNRIRESFAYNNTLDCGIEKFESNSAMPKCEGDFERFQNTTITGYGTAEGYIVVACKRLTNSANMSEIC